eukprot:10118313-Alexandrium_andersonii.AAC.1
MHPGAATGTPARKPLLAPQLLSGSCNQPLLMQAHAFQVAESQTSDRKIGDNSPGNRAPALANSD